MKIRWGARLALSGRCAARSNEIGSPPTPAYEAARAKLARFYGILPEQLLLTNGTDDAIKVICESFVEPGDVLLVPAPTFPIYQFFHEVAGGRTERVYFDQNFEVPLKPLLTALRKVVRWVAFASPNNPTGTTVPRRDLRVMIEAAPRTVFVVDEAYYEFSGETVIPWLRKYPNLIVTRTFSKAFGLAALRMGCILTNPETAEMMRPRAKPLFGKFPSAHRCSCGNRPRRLHAPLRRPNPRRARPAADLAHRTGNSLGSEQGEFHPRPVRPELAGNRPASSRQENPGARLELRSAPARLSAHDGGQRAPDENSAARTDATA